MKDLNFEELRFLLDLIVSQLPKDFILDETGAYLSDPDQIVMVRVLYRVASTLCNRIELPF